MRNEILNSKMLKISVPIVIILFIIFIATQKVYVASINNQTLGYIKSIDLVKETEANLIDELSKNYGTAVAPVHPITYTKISKRKVEMSTEADIKKTLKTYQQFTVQGYELKINNILYASTLNKTILDTLIANVKTQFMDKYANLDQVNFQEDVSIKGVTIDVKKLSTKEEIETLQAVLLNGEKAQDSYIVQKGDTVGAIAKKHKMSIDEIKAANPDINLNRIKIGQKINISVPKKILHIKTK